MKKLISLLVIFSLIFTFVLSTHVFAAGTQLVFSAPSCQAGEEVSVEISMPSNSGMVSMQLVIEYDSALTLTAVVDGGILGEYNHSDKLQSPYILSWENDKIRENITETGKLVTLKFKVSADAEAKDYPVTVSHSELLDKDINDVECSITNGYVTVYSKKTDNPVVSGGGGGGGAGPAKPEKPAETEDTAESEQPVNPAKPAISFSDVSANDWFYEYVTELSEKNIISGNGNGTFAPTDNVTREQFLKMLLLAVEIDVKEAENTFADVDNKGWYKDYVLSAKNLGIVNGVSETEFGIGLNITRQDMAVMISRTIEKLGLQIDAQKVQLFADDSMVSNYAKDAVTFMKSIGLIEGYNNEFRPLDNLTRAEAARVISQLIKL